MFDTDVTCDCTNCELDKTFVLTVTVSSGGGVTMTYTITRPVSHACVKVPAITLTM
jgi:hypothetical protein